MVRIPAVTNPRLMGAMAERSVPLARTAYTPTIEASTPMARAISGKRTPRAGFSPIERNAAYPRMIEATRVTSYDSNRSAAMPAQSPTLSPTLSAMVAGLRGSSSGMPASTLPTRSAPTSAALVKMPPPTRRNRASNEPPNPKPTRMAEAVFWKMAMMTVAPKRPRPTVNMPAMPPVRKATLRAAGSDPDLAAAAVRTLPLVASVMPMKPVRPDITQPAMNASVRAVPEAANDNAMVPSDFTTLVDVT